jgi:TRAP-type mannitol/chloroaromatic compound transport system permease small subunit
LKETTNSDGASGGGRRSYDPLRLWTLAVEGLAALGTVLIGGLMLIICADIVARNLFGSSLPLVSELGALLLVMIVALQLAATVRAERLARTEIFFEPFAARYPRAGNVVRAIFNLLGATMVGGMAWATIGTLQKDWASAEFIGTPGLGTLPTWPFRALILLGLTVAAIEFVVRVVTPRNRHATREAGP